MVEEREGPDEQAAARRGEDNPVMMISVLVLLAALPPSASAPSASPRRVPVGEWGGPHVRLEVQETKAILELDCAHGVIEGALRLRKAGRFEAKGRLQFEGGAQFSAEAEEGRPARYSGSLKGKVLTLNIVTEDGSKAGPYRLERGAPAELVKCQ
jgi:hypothetical protein